MLVADLCVGAMLVGCGWASEPDVLIDGTQLTGVAILGHGLDHEGVGDGWILRGGR